MVFARIDDPEHHRLRRMMTSQFTFRRTEAMRPQIQELVDKYLDEMIDKGPPADIVRDFGLPVPSMVIALLLGVPPEDLELFQHNTTVGLDVRSTDEQRAQGFVEMYAYIQELVARKEREPGDDLISRLVTEYVATGQLDHDTVAVNGVIMMQAGHETTANMISLGTVALLEHPRSVRAARPDRRSRRHRQHRRGADALPHHRAHPGGPGRDRRPHPRRPADPRRGQVVDEPARRKLGHRIRRQPRDFRHRPKHPRALGFRLRRAPMHRSQPGASRDAGRVRHVGAPAPGLKLAVPPDELKFKDADIYGMKELPVTW